MRSLKPISLLLCGALLADCAASRVEVAPASRPASVPVVLDFQEVPEGYLLSFDAARALLIAQRRKDVDHELALLDVQERAALAESRAKVAEQQVTEMQSWWGRYGFVVGFGGGALLTGLVVGAAAYAVTR